MGNNLAEQQQNWGAVSLGFIGVVSLRPAVGLAGWGLVGAPSPLRVVGPEGKAGQFSSFLLCSTLIHWPCSYSVTETTAHLLKVYIHQRLC